MNKNAKKELLQNVKAAHALRKDRADGRGEKYRGHPFLPRPYIDEQQRDDIASKERRIYQHFLRFSRFSLYSLSIRLKGCIPEFFILALAPRPRSPLAVRCTHYSCRLERDRFAITS